MRLGTENRGMTVAAAVLGVLGLVLFVRMVVLSGAGAAAPPASPAGPATPRAPAGTTRAAVPATLDPTLRLDLLKPSEETEYQGSGRNIFRAFVEPPPPPKITDKQAESCVMLHPGCPGYVPPPPPIDLKFFGFASRPGEVKKVFLSQGDSVFIGKEGDIINRRYRILKIGTNSVDIEDVLNNNRQTIYLTQG